MSILAMPTSPLRAAVCCCFLLVSLLVAHAAEENHPPIHVNHPALKSLSWQLAAQAGTFRDRSTFDMIELLHSLDCHHIELAPGQALSPERAGVVVGSDMAPADIDSLLAKLKSVKMDIVSYGPVVLKDDADAKRAFGLAKQLKAKNLVIAESAGVPMETLDRLADGAKVKAALLLHHAGESSSDVENILGALSKCSARVGVCAEVDGAQKAPAAAEAIKQLGSRLLEVHLKNITPDAAAVLQQLKDQGFKGICAVNQEPGGGVEALNAFIASVNAFSDILAKVAGAP
jgi:hypothetical protein